MTKITAHLTSLLFICLVSTIAVAQISSPKIDSLMEEALIKFKVAGASIAVVKDGKVIHQKGYGVTSIATKKSVNENTNFQIASNSKAFTTTALAILEDEGKLKWTDKVKDHLPEFKMYNEYVTENFNIQDLLTHRSGLGLGVGDLMFFPDGSNFTIKDVLSSFQYFKPVSAFRTKFDYDNLLYFIAGEVIARASGMSYEAFVQKRIVDPLQMNNTFVGSSLMKDKSNLATPHSSESGTIKTIDAFGDQMNSAAGGIFSNVADMAKWMILQLNEGKYGTDFKSTLFSLENHDEMWTIHTVLPSSSNPYSSRYAGYGLGWFLDVYKENSRVGHGGGLPGMLSQVVLFPDKNLGIVVLTNTEAGGHGLVTSVTNTIVDRYLGLEDAGWTDIMVKRLKDDKSQNDEVTKKVWAKVDSVKDTRIKTQDYVGIYEDNWFGKIDVFLKGGQLWMKCERSPKLNGPMAFYNANTFAIKWEYQAMNCDAFAMFSLDETGKAQSIKMKGISPNIDFSFDFQDLDLKRIDK